MYDHQCSDFLFPDTRSRIYCICCGEDRVLTTASNVFNVEAVVAMNGLFYTQKLTITYPMVVFTSHFEHQTESLRR